MHKRSSSSDGFSLIEVLVSLVLLVIGVLGMASLTGTVMEGNRSVTNYTRAAETLREKVEEMQSVPIRGVISGADVDSVGGVEFDRAWTVTVNSPAPGLRRVNLTASWDDPRGRHTVRTETVRGLF
jgi:type IV pilus assembly protein PilV